ncbi:MAG: glycosyltransferase family 2 protein [bacterium]|nr:glycosyltransferase family 2 protein [bacterium]
MSSSPELSVIVPTFNERTNISEVIRRLDSALGGIAWEVIFVDDNSPDRTADLVREIAQGDSRVRIIQRLNRRGLSTACIEGMFSSSAPYLAVMDADMQHDEQILPIMLEAVEKRGYEVVVGSRYVEGGSVGELGGQRRFISQFASKLARLVLKANLKDPMSGFFLLRREVIDEAVDELSGIGFKILLDIFASTGRPLKFSEVPYTFRNRFAGESKLDSFVTWEYLIMLLDKSIGRYVPIRFVSFAFIGGVGVVVHITVLWTIFKVMDQRFVIGQTAATLVAMTANFYLNNIFTYRDRRLHGWNLLKGWISFSLACSIGAVANVGIATYLFGDEAMGNIGWILPAMAGIIVGAVWNYAVTSVYTWNNLKG